MPHTGVVPPAPAVNGAIAEAVTLEGCTAAPGAARRLVRQLVEIGEHRDTVELLVSELVTNAVCYTEGEVRLTIRGGVDQVRVEVSDTSPSLPAIRMTTLEGGRGLRHVDALADRWGADSRVDGKTVWFEVSKPTSGP